MEPENECPECGRFKSEDFDLCFECSQTAREEQAEGVTVRTYGRARETDKAVLFKFGRGFMGRSVWVPKSLVLEEGDEFIEIPRWFAEQEDLI